MSAGDTETEDLFDTAWTALKRFVPIDLFETKVEDERRKLGRINILIAGKTGVGKTTLINAIFGEAVGKTGVGRPVTREVKWYEPPGLPVRLCDTVGLELANFEATLGAVEQEIVKASASGRLEDRVHVAWFCISGGGSRIEDGEVRLAKICAAHGVPVIVVLTNARDPDEPEFERLVEAIRSEVHEAKVIVPVLALATKRTPAFGLEDLVRETYRVIPKEVENAFTAVEWIDLDRKLAHARQIAGAAAVAAAAAAAAPVPVVGTGAIITINIGMIAGIAVAMGVPVTGNAALALGASVAGGLVASIAGRLALGEALKFIPGFGTLAGGVLEASAAAAMTYGLGHGFAEFLLWFYKQNSRMPEGDELREGFKRYWATEPHKERTPPPA